MLTVEDKIAITEVLDILKHTRKQDVDKISPKFMEYLEKNSLDDYKTNLDHNKKIKDMQLRKKTRVFLAIIYRKFWCNDEQRNAFDRKLKDNEIRHQKEAKEKYNPDNIFKKQKQIESVQEDEVSIMTYKESIFKKIINRIIKFFKNS